MHSASCAVFPLSFSLGLFFSAENRLDAHVNEEMFAGIIRAIYLQEIKLLFPELSHTVYPEGFLEI